MPLDQRFIYQLCPRINFSCIDLVSSSVFIITSRYSLAIVWYLLFTCLINPIHLIIGIYVCTSGSELIRLPQVHAPYWNIHNSFLSLQLQQKSLNIIVVLFMWKKLVLFYNSAYVVVSQCQHLFAILCKIFLSTCSIAPTISYPLVIYKTQL